MALSADQVRRKFNVTDTGQGRRPMVFAHGFGCDQGMWSDVAPAFVDRFRVILFDNMGAGDSDLSCYDARRYGQLGAYAGDVLEICEALDLRDVIFVGHSVSAMIGMLAAIDDPSRFAHLVVVGPSPCYLNKGDYKGGFDEDALRELLDLMDGNFLGWSAQLAPRIMDNPDRPALGRRLTDSFCQSNPDIARQFARVTFVSDNRADLPRSTTPSLILQCADDIIAPPFVGDHLHAHLPQSRLVQLRATGHCPQVSHPDEVIEVIGAYLAAQDASATHAAA
jgi:sigma-B regulation protein RsbQ